MKQTRKQGRREPLLPMGEGAAAPSDPVIGAEPTVAAEVLAPAHERALFEPAHGEIHPGPLEPASEASDIHQGPLQPSLAGDIHPGPLDPAPSGEIQIGPLERSSLVGESGPAPLEAEIRVDPPAEEGTATATFETPLVAEVRNAPSVDAVAIAKRKKSWREQRWERRRRRIYFEEALAWVLVPVILIACYLGVKGILSAFGTSPTALIQGIQTALSSRS